MPESEIITIDDASRSSLQSPDICVSPSLTRPLQCITSPTALLRNYRHNPWIGGPGVLPSPTPSLLTNEDSNPPCLTPCDAIDSASDSGIDDMSIAENMSPLKRPYEQQNKQIENVYGLKAATIIVNNNNKGYDNTKMLHNENSLIKINNIQVQENLKASKIEMNEEEDLTNQLHEENEEEGASMSKRKRSISYLDSSNPLMTPFLMDLCNVDYHINTKEFLQENDIENVLNEWPVDLV